MDTLFAKTLKAKRLFYSRTLIVLSIFFICTQISNAQSKYGKTTMDEINMNSCEIDPTAKAVVLMKDGFTEFKYDDIKGFFYEYTYKVKIKILKEEGLDQCEGSISYYYGPSISSREEVRGLSGTTYNLENGKIEKTKLSKDFIVTEEYDDVNKRIKFTMPGAKVGSIIEYKYTLVSPYNYNLRSFNLQSYVPVLNVRYEIIIPEYFMYNQSAQGYEWINPVKVDDINLNFNMRLEDGDGRPFTYTDQCSAKKYIYTAENLVAMKEEPFIWSTEDYINRIDFELRSFQFKYSLAKQFSTTWNDVDKMLFSSNYFGGNLKKTGLFKDESLPGSKDLNAASAIVSLVRQKVKWNEKSEFAPDNLGKALKEGLGTSADLNFLAINALKAAGIDAFPIILSTRSNGRIPITHPSASAFNYSIAGILLDDKLYCIDVSDRYSVWNILPNKALISQARIMKEGNTRWADLTKSSKGVEYITSIYRFADDGQYQGEITSTYRDKSAQEFRRFYYNQHKDEQHYKDELAKKIALPIEDIKIEDVADISKEVKRSFVVKPDLVLGDEFLYIDPMLIKHFADNPFKAEVRKFPVQFNYLENHIQIVRIEIPEGYKVEELPESITYVLDEDNTLKFLYHVAVNGNTVDVRYHYTINDLLVLQTKYPELQDFYAKIVSKCSEMIVLKKIGEDEVVSITETEA